MAKMRYAEALNLALREEMEADPSVFLFGEDVGRYGGVFKVSKGLMEEFGESRVRNTPISEQALTAMAVTAAMTGTRPVLEIMYADFLPLTLDALINQASIYNYIWDGQVKMPLVLRTQGGGGAGAGAQHSKVLDGLVAHIPGIKVVAPVTPADARGMLRSAIRDDQPVVFLEHKLLYNLRDEVPDDLHYVPLGKARVVTEGRDVSIFATSKMVIEADKAAELLATDGVSAEVIDLRSLRPLDLDANLKGVYLCSRAVIPLMEAQGSGSIVNTASNAALVGLADRAAYVASKGAVAALTRAMALDHVKAGIRVNAVAPGTTWSSYFDRMLDEHPDPEGFVEGLNARAPMHRTAQPVEIARAILWLASDAASYATGSVMVVDGGMTAW